MTCINDAATQARAIVANPSAFANCPAVLQSAWADLKAARGQPVDLDRIGAPAHIKTCSGAATTLADHLAQRAPHIRSRVQRRAAILAGLPAGGGAA